MAKHRTARKFNNEQRRKIVEKIQKNIDSGMSVHGAIKKENIAVTMYYQWKKKFQPQTEVITYPNDQPAPKREFKKKKNIIAVMGDADSVSAFIKTMI